MDNETIRYHLRGYPLDGLDAQNLQQGRITRQLLGEVMRRHNITADTGQVLYLANDLNDMIEAAKALEDVGDVR